MPPTKNKNKYFISDNIEKFHLSKTCVIVLYLYLYLYSVTSFYKQ